MVWAPNEMLRRDEQARAARAEAERKAIVAREARETAKLERELDQLETGLRSDPPPELSPQEKKERELVERLEMLRGSDQAV